MNNWITRFAFGAKCGIFGASGEAFDALVAWACADWSCAIMEARANDPKPAPMRLSISRRVTGEVELWEARSCAGFMMVDSSSDFGNQGYESVV